MSNIRVMLADDHAVVRSGLRRMLEQHHRYEVVAEAGNGEDAYQHYGDHLPDIVVLDVSMPGMGGLEAIRRILTRFPSARVVIFSMHENAAFATQAMRAGARGYVSKTGAPEELLLAIQEIMQGNTYLSPSVAQKVAIQSLMGGGGPIQNLSAREFEVFCLLAEGKSAEDIGEILKISQKTASNYYTLIKQKLGVSTPLELIRLALRHGIIAQ